MRTRISAAIAAGPFLAQDRDMACGTEDGIAHAEPLWDVMAAGRRAGLNVIRAFPHEGLEPHGLMLGPFCAVGATGDHAGDPIVKRNFGPEGVTVDEVLSDPDGHLGACTVLVRRAEGHHPENLNRVRAGDNPDGSIAEIPMRMVPAGRAAALMFPDLALPALLGALLGASAHRAGLCTVKGVAEVMTTGQAHVLWSFLKASFWTLGILSVAALAGLHADVSSRPLMLAGLVAGIVFGIGAGLNGACSFSTLARLAEGHGVMLLTLAGWGLGLVAIRSLVPAPHGVAAATTLPAWLVLPGLA